MKKKLAWLGAIAALVVLLAASTALAESYAKDRVEGHGFVFSTGKAWVTSIVVAGYDSTEKDLYLNIAFKCANPQTDRKPSFSYTVTVFDNSGNELATQTGAAVGELNGDTASVKNVNLGLASDLPLAYRIVITVTQLQFVQ